jgi:glycosyltransferase involved in cell wall biosynthesis
LRRLVVFSHKLFRRTSDGYKTTGGFTIQMDALAPYFENVTLCVPLVDDADFYGVGPTAPNMDFHPLPHYRGRLDFLRKTPSIRREVLTVLNEVDVALVDLPGYVGVLASVLCQRRRFPLFQWVVGNWSRIVQVQRSTPLGRWLASVLWSPLIDKLMIRLTRDVLTFYTGPILYHQDKAYHINWICSSIRGTHLYVRRDSSSLAPPYRVLFVGRLSPEKGVKYLLQAVSLLISQGDVVDLRIVGTGALEGKLQREANDLAIADLVHFQGFVPHGEELRRMYRESDVFVLPSLEDQQPKVLLEAMSQSVPVIATNVGGIPSMIQNGENGLLISPAQPGETAEAIRQVTMDDELRQRLVEAGLTFASAHTVEQETAQMMKLVSAHFDQGGIGIDESA